MRIFLDAEFASRDERRGGFQSFPRRDHAMTSRDQPHVYLGFRSLPRRGQENMASRGESFCRGSN